ncbi:MAG: puuB 1 [Bacteroidota bacterium]|jgi:glycine/D-amino acid oxidase-like deaminating enzyme/nitrite reductase/ring-hydroxylating ferredoxin subunit|nr:puuB 1 [Bacteroidota bacterium]
MDNKEIKPFDSRVTSGNNNSFWIKTSPSLKYDKLTENCITEVVVVGGGIAGLTTAYCLLKAGKKVVLVEDGFLGSGESGRTTAHITCALDDRYYNLEKLFGRKKTTLIANSHMAAIQWVENTILRESIDCNYKRVNGYLFLSATDKRGSLEKEYESTKNVGLITKMLKYVPDMNAEDGEWSIEFPDQGQFHIMKYLKGLSEAIIKMGGKIYTETRAEEISSTGIKANGFSVHAKEIVVATNTPVNDWVTMHTKQWPYRTYVIGAKIPKGKLSYSLWWDTGDMDSKWISEPYHYVRVEPFDDSYDVLIAGGEDHKVGQADAEDIPEEERYLRLAKWTKKRFPEMSEIEYKWSGQVLEPIDSLAFIGKNPGSDNIYIITGDSGNGMTHATLGGMIITDLIIGRDNPWSELYDPSRITLKTTGDYLHEAGNMTAQYVDWITGSEIKEAENLKPCQGAVINSGMKKIAVYKDENNEIHACSGVCPHLGGVLKWNDDEKTFDCPVHGSRFTVGGTVINGPAVSDLKKIDIHHDSSVK